MGRIYRNREGDEWEEQPDGTWKKKMSIKREMKRLEDTFNDLDKRFK